MPAEQVLLGWLIVLAFAAPLAMGFVVEPYLRSRALGRRLEVQRQAGSLLTPNRCVVCGGAAETSLPHKPKRTISSRTDRVGSGRDAARVTTTTSETVTVNLPYCLDHARASQRNETVLSRTLWVVGTLVFIGTLATFVLGALGVIPGWRDTSNGTPIVQFLIALVFAATIVAMAFGFLAAAAARGLIGLFNRSMRLTPLLHRDNETLGAKVELSPTTVSLRAMNPEFRREFATLNHVTPV